MPTTQYADANGTVQATESINSDGSGYILTQKGTETIHILAGATPGAVYVNTAGDVATSIKSSNGTTDSYSLNGSQGQPVMTMAVNGHSVADGDVIKDIYQDATGGIDVMSNTSSGFPQSDFRINTDGTEAFTLGQDKLTFAANILTALAGGPAYATPLGLANSNDGTDFGLKSAAAGYNEDISWNATTGKALLNITNTSTGSTFSSSLGYINPGDTLKVQSSSLIGLYNSSGVELSSTQINGDGSQIDTNYNADGSVASVYQYNASGGVPGSTPTPGSVQKYYSNGGQEEAFGQVQADGSGYLYAETSGETIRFAAGSTQTNVTADGSGAVTEDLTAANGVKDTFVASGTSGNRVLTMNINTHAVVYADVIEDAVMSNTGSMAITAATAGFGLSNFTVGTDGSAGYSIGQDSIAFAAGSLASAAGNSTSAGSLKLADPNNGAAFGLNSAATGFNEDVSWNASTGQAVLNLTNIAGGNVITTSLGQINPGDVLKVSGALIALYDGNNHKLDSVQVNSDGSQTDTTYNANGTVASVITYDNKGNETSGPGSATGTSDGKYVDANGVTEATKGLSTDGSGYIFTQKGSETVHFVTSDSVTALSVNTAGDVTTSIKTANGIVDSFALTGSQGQPIMSMNVNGHSVSDGDVIKDIYTDASGNLDIKAYSAAGFGESDLLVNTDGTESFTLGSDNISFAAGVLTKVGAGSYATTQGLANPNSGVAFGLTSAATGFSEDVSWNATSGKALLNLTNTTTGSTFSTSLGYINSGDTLKVLSNSLIALYDGSGHILNSIQINADGSQLDTNYSANGSVSSTYSYDANGNLLATKQVAQLAIGLAAVVPASSSASSTSQDTAAPQALALAVHH